MGSYYNKSGKRFCSCYEEFKYFKDIALRENPALFYSSLK